MNLRILWLFVIHTLAEGRVKHPIKYIDKINHCILRSNVEMFTDDENSRKNIKIRHLLKKLHESVYGNTCFGDILMELKDREFVQMERERKLMIDEINMVYGFKQ